MRLEEKAEFRNAGKNQSNPAKMSGRYEYNYSQRKEATRKQKRNHFAYSFIIKKIESGSRFSIEWRRYVEL